MSTSGRLLRLLSLLQMPRDWPGPELADRLEVSARTVRYDIERLRDLGYPVHATRGSNGGYRLEAGTSMPPLLLDDDEAVALAISLRTAPSGALTGRGSRVWLLADVRSGSLGGHRQAWATPTSTHRSTSPGSLKPTGSTTISRASGDRSCRRSARRDGPSPRRGRPC